MNKLRWFLICKLVADTPVAFNWKVTVSSDREGYTIYLPDSKRDGYFCKCSITTKEYHENASLS